eukprot:g16571.t1
MSQKKATPASATEKAKRAGVEDGGEGGAAKYRERLQQKQEEPCAFSGMEEALSPGFTKEGRTKGASSTAGAGRALRFIGGYGGGPLSWMFFALELSVFGFVASLAVDGNYNREAGHRGYIFMSMQDFFLPPDSIWVLTLACIAFKFADWSPFALDLRALACARIACGLTLLAIVVFDYDQWSTYVFLSEGGVIGCDDTMLYSKIGKRYQYRPQPWCLLGGDLWPQILRAVLAACSVCLIVGWRSNVATTIAWTCMMYFFSMWHKTHESWSDGTAAVLAMQITGRQTPVTEWLLSYSSQVSHAIVPFLVFTASMTKPMVRSACLGLFCLLVSKYVLDVLDCAARSRSSTTSNNYSVNFSRGPYRILNLLQTVCVLILMSFHIGIAVVMKLGHTSDVFELVGLNQNWRLFAPRPTREALWIVGAGILRSDVEKAKAKRRKFNADGSDNEVHADAMRDYLESLVEENYAGSQEEDRVPAFFNATVLDKVDSSFVQWIYDKKQKALPSVDVMTVQRPRGSRPDQMRPLTFKELTPAEMYRDHRWFKFIGTMAKVALAMGKVAP